MFVAIDRATRYVWVKVLPRRTAATVTQAIEEFLAAFPQKVHTILTDNDGALTDRFAVHKKGKPAGQPTGTHRLDHLCRAHGIIHRLIRPYHPQTNGMVERFNRRLSDAFQSQPPLRPHCNNRFRSHAERNAFITRVVDNYNRTRLRCLNYQAPLHLLQNLTGHNTYKGGERRDRNFQRMNEHIQVVEDNHSRAQEVFEGFTILRTRLRDHVIGQMGWGRGAIPA